MERCLEHGEAGEDSDIDLLVDIAPAGPDL